VLTLIQNVRFGIAAIARSPFATLGAALTLALAVGANGAVYTMVSGTLINGIPWDNPDRIVVLRSRNPQGENRNQIPYLRYRDWRDQSDSFAYLAAATPWPAILEDRDRKLPVIGSRVTPGVFEFIGTQPALGRTLTPADAEAGAPAVVVLGHSFWRNQLDADPEILGKELTLGGTSSTVVGVLQHNDWFPNPGVDVLGVLDPRDLEANRSDGQVFVLGVLAPNVAVEQAQVEMDVIGDRLGTEYPETDKNWKTVLSPASDLLVGPNGGLGLWVLMGGVAAVLLIACTNVANLLSVRAAARRKELAIRSAMGASRGQLILQLLAENSILAIISFPIGALVTYWTLGLILDQLPPQISWFDQIFRFDGPVWAFLIGLSALTVLLFGLAPAVRSSRVDVNDVLKEEGDRGSSGGRGGRLRSALTVLQIAGSLALLTNAGLLARSLEALMKHDAGFDMNNLLVTYFELPAGRYASAVDWTRFQESVIRETNSLPDVITSYAGSTSLLNPDGPRRRISLAGESALQPGEEREVHWLSVSPDFVTTLGLAILRGRGFDARDDASSLPVAMIDEVAVRDLFDGANPLGQSVVLPDGSRREIVGVIQNVERVSINSVNLPRVLVPFAQEPTAFFNLIARTRKDPLSLGTATRRALQRVDPALPIYNVSSLTQNLADALWPVRLFAFTMSFMGLLAYALATIGIYSVVSTMTAQQSREFGIRAALGAEPRQIATMVLRRTAWLAGIGLAIGLPMAGALASLLRTLSLVQVDSADPVATVGSVLLIGLASLAASAVPTIRAVQVDPMLAMRAS